MDLHTCTLLKSTTLETFYEPAGTREVERHISCAGRHLVAAVLHYAASGRF